MQIAEHFISKASVIPASCLLTFARLVGTWTGTYAGTCPCLVPRLVPSGCEEGQLFAFSKWLQPEGG
eukprot:4508425-Prymnesium_polylepis.1